MRDGNRVWVGVTEDGMEIDKDDPEMAHMSSKDLRKFLEGAAEHDGNWGHPTFQGAVIGALVYLAQQIERLQAEVTR